MKIVDIETIMLRLPKVELVGDGCQAIAIIKVLTDEGIIGLGEVHTNPLVTKAIIDGPVNALVSRGLKEILIGEDPRDVNRLWDKMYRYSITYGRRGAVMHAISGIDVALWDITGKAAGLPIHKLLGGARQSTFECYASDLSPERPEELAMQAQKHIEAGYHAMKFGWGKLGGSVQDDLRGIESVRQTIGDDPTLMIDMGMPIPLEDAIYLGNGAADYNLFFIEEPLDPRDLSGFRQLTEKSATPIATGEKEDTLEPYIQLMEIGGLRIIQPDVTRVGGITESLRIVKAAEERGARVIPHCWSCDILVAATMQVLSQMRSPEYLEFNVTENPIRRGVVAEPFLPENGKLSLSQKPGLGVELNLDTIEKYQWLP